LYIAVMRGVLTVIMIFFITSSCFALKPEPAQPAYHSVSEKKVTALTRYLNKVHQEDSSNVSQDEFEHPTLIRQLLNKTAVFSIQLFHHPEIDSAAIVRLYTTCTQTSYNFIFHFLYPKHVFW